jgi:hypothetical protein
MRFLPAALALIALSASAIPAFPAAFPSKVSRVVLYPDAAEVTRTIVVSPPSAVVEISGLPSGIRPDSIAARVTSGEATIAGFTAEDTFRIEPAPEKVVELEKRIETLSDSRRQAEDAIRSARREQELLDQGILALYRGEPAGPAPLEKAARPARLAPAEIEAALALIPLIAAGDPRGGPIAGLPRGERFHWLVAPRSAVIQTSPVHTGLCEDPSAALDQLIERLVRPPR